MLSKLQHSTKHEHQFSTNDDAFFYKSERPLGAPDRLRRRSPLAAHHRPGHHRLLRHRVHHQVHMLAKEN